MDDDIRGELVEERFQVDAHGRSGDVCEVAGEEEAAPLPGR